MKYALVDMQRLEAQPDLSGVCPVCHSSMIARCGEQRVWHWAHRTKRNCDCYWEPETEWHRAWKNLFPTDWQEVVHFAEDDEKHVADVKTEHGLTIEFQHSHLKPEERRSREAFYGNMVWVVNGLRLESFRESFDKQLHHAKAVENSPIKLRLPTGSCSILRAWAGSSVDVYLDFGEEALTDDRFDFSKPILWRLCCVGTESHVELVPVWREVFVDAALDGGPINGVHDPDLAVMREAKILTEVAEHRRREAQSPKFQRRGGESDVEYALRVWDIDAIN